MNLYTLIIVFILGVSFIIFLKIRDKKYLEKSVKDALGKNLKEEIEEEREMYYKHKEKFNKALKQAKDPKSNTHNFSERVK